MLAVSWSSFRDKTVPLPLDVAPGGYSFAFSELLLIVSLASLVETWA